MVTGVYCEAKVSTALKMYWKCTDVSQAKTSDNPSITVVNFSAFPLQKGEVKQLSVGGVKEQKPASAYQLPGMARKN